MPQTVWKGALSFGLVNVPVALVGTTRKTRVAFRQLHKKDKAPIRQERHCTLCDEVVEKDDLTKGAEVEKGVFVEVTDEELDAAEPPSTRAISVREFVSQNDVDPLYIERSYALAPEAGGEKAYVLLHDALSRRGEAAIGKVTIRGHEYVVAIRAGPKLLFADILHYPDEVRDLTEVERKVQSSSEPTPEERELADMIVERLHKDWDPTKYEDTYGERVRELIRAKAQGETFQAPEVERKAPTVDLLAALRETLKQQENAPREAKT